MRGQHCFVVCRCTLQTLFSNVDYEVPTPSV